MHKMHSLRHHHGASCAVTCFQPPHPAIMMRQPVLYKVRCRRAQAQLIVKCPASIAPLSTRVRSGRVSTEDGLETEAMGITSAGGSLLGQGRAGGGVVV